MHVSKVYGKGVRAVHINKIELRLFAAVIAGQIALYAVLNALFQV